MKKRLSFKKSTIATLNNQQMNDVYAGDSLLESKPLCEEISFPPMCVHTIFDCPVETLDCHILSRKCETAELSICKKC
ncbi:MAG: class I lanthipeptide [Hyphomicrobiales bacterium]